MTENTLYCPECNEVISKAGSAWSGRNKVQQFKCHSCGRCTIRPLDEAGNQIEAKPFVKEKNNV